MRNFAKILIVSLLLLLAAGEWLYRSGYGARAGNAPPVTEPQLSVAAAAPVQKQSASNQQGVALESASGLVAASMTTQSAAISSPSSIQNRLPENIPANPIIDEFRTLYTQFASQYIQPGWLHTVYQEEHPAAEGPADTEYGISIPPTFLFETWYQINASNQVVEGVSLMRDLSGQLIQVSVYRNKVWHNLTINENMTVDRPPSLRLDGRFLLHLEDAYSRGAQLSKTGVLVENQNLIRFTYREVYDTPLVVRITDASSIPAQETSRSAYVDPTDGRVVVLETMFKTISGQELVTLRTILRTIENVSAPPAEILEYLGQVK